MASFEDTFVRADAADLGANWTGSSWSGEASPSIVSNQCKAVGGYKSAYYSALLLGADQEATVDWIAGGPVYFNMRVQQPGGGTLDCYEFRYASAGACSISKVVNETPASLASTTGPTLVTGHQFRFRCVGTSLSQWYRVPGGDWTLLNETTDATVTGAGYAGMELPANAILSRFSACDVLPGKSLLLGVDGIAA